MNKTYKFVTILLLFSVFSCAQNSNREFDNESVVIEDDCAAPLTKWMEVNTGYSSIELKELASTFQAAANADAKNLKVADGSANFNFSSNWKSAFERAAQGNKKAQVSQVFFEQATAYRHAVCNIERHIKEGTIKSEEALVEAEILLIDLSKNFGLIKEGKSIGVSEVFLKPKEESQNLFNHWMEAKVINVGLGAAKSGEYIALGNSILKIDDSSLNRKTTIMKYDRASLMFLLASEIIISSNTGKSDLVNDAIIASKQGRDAASSGIDHYNKLVKSGPTQSEREWLTREEPNLVLIHRKAETLAQLAFLLPDQSKQYLKEVDNAISNLSCEYINYYKLREDILFTRIQMSQSITNCMSA